MSLQSEVEATIKRISGHPSVLGMLVLGDDGTPIKSTFEVDETAKYSSLLTQFAALSRSAVRDIDPTNDLSYVRVRSTNHEYICIPDKKFHIIVVTGTSDGQ
ncbi:dynein light chain roadblock-type 1/2 [Kipferlia bialata]|uniref:Dynein light chain roadblock n=1 Tax=Kipferlia bialata TaxID=797122 RepID=A0A391NRQ1_9EUKA|nr:dynein light chain roadblock-type 1/2 [Kipferlia bialata]|eukprot:g9668.t1